MGEIPAGAIVLVHTGWGRHWGNRVEYLGTEKTNDASDLHFPGIAQDAAEYLARQYGLLTVPAWAFEPVRYLERAWHTTPFDNDAMREYLTFASPAEFRSRNIFTEERPLRRARSGLKQL